MTENVAKVNRLSGFRASLRERVNEVGLLVALIALVVILATQSENFLSTQNLFAILQDAALVGIVAWAATLVIITGEIDLSVGPAVAFWGVVLADLVTNFHVPFALAVIIVLGGGALAGAGAGWLRAKFDVPTFISTLGLWSAFRGLAYFFTGAMPISVEMNGFMTFLVGRVFGVPMPAVIMFVLFFLFYFLSKQTTFGRAVFAVGGNAKAAELGGINVAYTRVMVFALSGLMSAFLGIIIAARLSAGSPGAAQGLEFSAIAAVVIGGTLLMGGKGTMTGTLLGVLFVTVIGNGLVLLGVNSFLQDVIRGALIVIAVLLNLIVAKRSAKRPVA
jgi:ribose/xylose/arabinose/galactoside ABC-type transport system permease subunit